MINFIHHCLSYFRKPSTVLVSPIDSLAPKILTQPEDLLKIKPYLEALKKTIDDPDITNIALTGDYGSGKSTIIKTFQSQNPGYEYLNLSLASFKDVNPDGQGDERVKNLERLLEISILQQIFYHVKPTVIPDSRFKRIVNVTSGKIWFFAVSLILWVASTLILFQAGYVSKLNPQTWDTTKQFDFFAPLPFFIFFLGIGLFAKTFIRLFSNSKINKLTIKGEVELGDKIDKSVFNEHLEEIIYFFERTAYNVVVIEDLDRFETTDIFTKLREINLLLNRSVPIGRKISFVYAIKDAMFTDKSERVKFFEYIIPVIPFINPSNAGEQMARLIKNASLENILSKEFTEDVVTFIDDIDMRLLTNIFHEYQLYRLNLSEDLNQDELFAMITYKNLFPDDFGELHKRRGRLYNFVTSKHKYIADLLISENRAINDLEQQIQNIDEQQVDDLLDLRKIYVLEYFKQVPNASTFKVNDQHMTIADLIEEDNFNELKKLNTIIYNSYRHNYSNQYYQVNDSLTLPFSKIENSVNENFTYSERVEIINGKIEYKQNLLQTQIQEKRNLVADIESWRLKKIFEIVNIDPYLDTFSDNYLVRNLFVNGYLNENYSDYISLFHAVNFTKEDNTFLRNVKSGVVSPYTYKLTRIDNVYRRIHEKYFTRQVVLNFDLMNYMASNYDLCENSYEAIIKQLYLQKGKLSSFIEGYIDTSSEHIDLFISRICNTWKGFWDEIVIKGNFTTEKKDQYLLLIFKYAAIRDIINMGANIKQYVEKHEDPLSLLQAVPSVKESLTSLAVKLERLSPSTEETRELFDHVYTKSLYKINPANIAVIVKDKSPSSDAQCLDKANYTVISKSGCIELQSYIAENIEAYVKGVVLNSSNHEEEESFYITLLNDEGITDGTKIALIGSQSAIITDINNVEDPDIRVALISSVKIKVDWENLLSYFAELEVKEMDEVLIDFLNKPDVYLTLSKQLITEVVTHSKEDVKTFFVRILHCDELSYDAYTSVIKAYPARWIRLSFEHLEKDKVKYLVVNNWLTFDVNHYDKLRENFNSEAFHIAFIENNQTKFFEQTSDITIEEAELIKLLQSSKLSLERKAELIEHVKNTDENLIIKNSSISRLACSVLAKSPHTPIPFTLLESFFKSSWSVEERIIIFNKQVNQLTDDEVEGLVSRLGSDYKDMFKKQHKPTFPITSYHEALFTELKSRSLIKDFALDSKKVDKYRVIANYQ